MKLIADATVVAAMFGPASELVDEVVVDPQPDRLCICGYDKPRSEVIWTTADPVAFATYEAQSKQFGVDLTPLRPLIEMLDGQQLTMTTPPHSDRVNITSAVLSYRGDLIDPETIWHRAYSKAGTTGETILTIPHDLQRLKLALLMADRCAQSVTIQVHTTHANPVVELTARGANDKVYAPFSDDHLASSAVSDQTYAYLLNNLPQIYKTLAEYVGQHALQISKSGVLTIIGEHRQTPLKTRYDIAPLANK